MLGGELYLRLRTVLKPTLDLMLHGSSGDRCVIVGEGWEAVKECSDSFVALVFEQPRRASAPRSASKSRCAPPGRPFVATRRGISARSRREKQHAACRRTAYLDGDEPLAPAACTFV